MLKNKKRNIEISLLCIILITVVFVFMPIKTAKADFLGWVGLDVPTITAAILSLVFSAVGKLISWMVQALDWFAHIEVYPRAGVSLVMDSWKILRDMSNMFFIIALILMAFGTLFDVGSWWGSAKGYNWKSMLARFLIAAVLINFSLVLGGLVISGAQIFTNTFLTAMGDISGRLGQGLDLTSLLPEGSVSGNNNATITTSVLLNSIVSLIFALILLFSFLFSTIVALIFIIVRIPIIWALLIVSPLIWIALIFPGTKKYFDMWWKYFLGWNLFLPYFLFFLYFALLFSVQRPQVINSVVGNYATQSIGGQTAFTIQNIVSYALICITLIGGTLMSVKASMFSGTGIGKVVDWGKKAAWMTPGFREMLAAKRAGGELAGQVKKEGLPGWAGKLYGGEAADKLRQAKWASRFGVRDAGFRVQKDFINKAKIEFDGIEEKYNSGQLSIEQLKSLASGNKADDPKGFAYRKMLAKLKQLDTNTLSTTVSQLRNNPLAVQDFMKVAKEGKFGDVSPEELTKVALGEGDYSFMRAPQFVSSRREILQYIQSDKKLASKLDEKRIKEAITVLGGNDSPEAKSFLEEAGKLRPDLSIRYRITNNMLKAEEGKVAGVDVSGMTDDKNKLDSTKLTDDKKKELLTALMEKAVRVKTEDLVNMPESVWKDREFFQPALRKRITNANLSLGARRDLIKNIQRTLDENGEAEKLRIFREEMRIEIGQQNQPSENPPPQNPPAGGTTVSNPDINQNNIIDLRNKNREV